jgi:sialate O-acetylesterase
MRKNISIVCMIILSFMNSISAKVTLPHILGDNMLLQQNENVKIWGQSTAALKEIIVWCSWNKKSYKSNISSNGNWEVSVKTPKYGGPYSITIDDGDVLNINNILIGDVYFCSGQSNMEMPLAGWGKVNNFEEEIKNANYPDIRILQAQKTTSNVPTDNITFDGQGWGAVTSESIENFSATAYFFAKEIYAHTGVPIGLIHSSWGGTIIESWISKEGLMPFSKYANTITRISNPNAHQLYLKDLAIWNSEADKQDAVLQETNGKWFLNADFSSWTTLHVPSHFDKDLFPNLNGVVYYTKEISIPKDWQGKDIKLILGAIDDNDITYVNQIKVGETEGYNVNRIYSIPADNNKKDIMTINIRVFDGSGEGGVYSGGELPRLENSLGQTISLIGDWKIKVGYDLSKLPDRPVAMEGPNRPTVLFNAMVQPFLNYAIKGVIWYQGESNADYMEDARLYNNLLPALIQNWRQKWGKPNMPFYYAQLANFKEPSNHDDQSNWAVLRNAQLETLKLPHTGMAVLADVGDAKDIHPKDKQEVGRRLGLIARNKLYNQKIDYSGPNISKYKLKKSEVILTFNVSKKDLIVKKSS